MARRPSAAGAGGRGDPTRRRFPPGRCRGRLGLRLRWRLVLPGREHLAAAALRDLGADGRVTVAELVPAVVEWNRGPLAQLCGNPLADQRLDVHLGDVADLLRTQTAVYDAILLDVDNGPHGLTTSANHWLYGPAGLTRTFPALRPGGVLGVWSAGPDEAFTRRLGQAGFAVECVRTPAHGARGRKHVIWLGSRGK